MKRFFKLFCVTFIGLFILQITGENALAREISDISVRDNGDTVFIDVQTSTGAEPEFMALGGANPRLVFDFNKTKTTNQIETQLKEGHFDALLDGMASLRLAKRDVNGVRLVIDLDDSSKYKSHSFSDNVLRMELRITKDIQVVAEIPYPRLNPKTVKPVSYSKVSVRRVQLNVPVAEIQPLKVSTHTALNDELPLPRLRPSRAYKPMIIIDPGHGGHDPGAIGAKGTYEANVTLKAAQELKQQLVQSGRYKVVLTRQDNTYVEHDDRILVARKAGADLFISVHADSTANKATRGASVYTLADRATNRSKRIVNSQNWISDVDLASHSAQVSDILVDLAQRKTRSESARFANVLIPQLKTRTKLLGNTHRQAGYYVLLAPDVPAVLLELGFISNTRDEKNLASPAHRRKVMRGVTEAINMYFNTQTPLQAR